MGKLKSFEEFLKSNSKSYVDAEIDWDQRRQVWKLAVEDLFTKIESDWLNDYQDDIEISNNTLTISEPGLGTFVIGDLSLQIGNLKYYFKPIGSNIIGGQGRIDVFGPRRKALLIKVKLDSEEWRIVQPHKRGVKGQALDQESLKTLLMFLAEEVNPYG